MKKILIIIVLAAIAVGAYMMLNKPKPPVAAVAAQEAALLYDGEVIKIDATTRAITLKNQDGESTIVAGPEVKNFAQIKMGDRLDVQYALAVAIELVKTKSNDVRGREVMSDTKTAPAGNKPSMVKTNIIKTTASVVAIDQKKQIVSLKGPKGNVVDVKVENPVLLKGITTKDQVYVTYAEAVAAVVSAPKK